MKVTLFIDTSSNEHIRVGLEKNEHTVYLDEKATHQASQMLLPLIEKLLQQEKCSFQEIGEIKVHRGPGSFTGVRVGVTVTNALGWSLGISVNNKKIELPVYEPSKFDD